MLVELNEGRQAARRRRLYGEAEAAYPAPRRHIRPGAAQTQPAPPPPPPAQQQAAAAARPAARRRQRCARQRAMPHAHGAAAAARAWHSSARQGPPGFGAAAAAAAWREQRATDGMRGERRQAAARARRVCALPAQHATRARCAAVRHARRPVRTLCWPSAAAAAAGSGRAALCESLSPAIAVSPSPHFGPLHGAHPGPARCGRHCNRHNSLRAITVTHGEDQAAVPAREINSGGGWELRRLGCVGNSDRDGARRVGSAGALASRRGSEVSGKRVGKAEWAKG